ncbi:MAG: hypothetical protein GX845_01990 [Erysipelothrix sp.]|jgi:hypothetical protein|nr:hypothetical protein [Erysipelothrix sp.]
MDNQTRIKKYAQLREKIAQDVEKINYHDALAPFAKRLSMVDEKYEVEDVGAPQNYQPKYAKTKAYQDLFNEDTDDFLNNELLSQFIDEVKDYNLQAGTRVADETTENIIQSMLQSEAVMVEAEPEPVTEQEKHEAIQEIFAADHDELIEDVLAKIDEVDETHFSDVEPEDDEDLWLTKTQELTQIIETMEHNLSDVNQKMNVTNKLVNVLLVVFILGLLFVIAYGIYFVLQLQGII